MATAARGLVLLLVLAAGHPGSARAQQADQAPPVSLHPPAHILRLALAKAPAAILVRFGPPPDDRVFVAHSVDTSATQMRAFLLDPDNFARALPAFVKTRTVTRRQRKDADAEDRAVDWELEIPLWNLHGRLWLKPFAGAVQLRLVQGAFAPGSLTLRAISLGADRSILTLEGRASAENTNLAMGMLAKRHALARPAMNMAAVVTLVRALALIAAREHGVEARDPDRRRALETARWPTAAMKAPPVSQLDVGALRNVAELIDARLPLGLVHISKDGRLAQAQVGWIRSGDAARMRRALFDASLWRSLPGWNDVRASARVAGLHGEAARWSVTSRFPFVDFSATWDVTLGQSLRGRGSAGVQVDAAWAWHVDQTNAGALAIHTSHPRIDLIGYIPAAFIKAEPLLEPGMAVALTFVNAVSLLQALPD